MQPISLDYFDTINQTTPHSNTSGQYAFIPTVRVADILKRHDWFPVMASEARTKTEEMKGYQKHLLRFRHKTFSDVSDASDCLAEIVLTNSHNAKASFQIMAGIFRLVCSNGLIVSDSTFTTHRITHRGYREDDVENAIDDVVNTIPLISANITEMRQITLDEKEKEVYAASAIMLRWDDESLKSIPEPCDLLEVRRSADNRNDLFTTFNVVQENMMKGMQLSFRKRKIRGISSIDKNITLNKALWTLTEKMKELKN